MSADLPAELSDAPPRRPVSWLGLAAAGLVVALLAVALLQTRQQTLLRQALDAGDDRAAVAVYQAETEYLRLRERWRQAADPALPFDIAGLQQAWRGWAARLAPLQDRSLQRWTGGETAHQAVLQPLQAFVASADAALAGRAPAREAVAALLPALLALGEPLHALSAEVARGQAAQFDQRVQTVQDHTRLNVGLTVFLSLLTLAFAAVALRQLHQLRQRRVALEELAAHLRQARREAESASAAKSAFLANMSHEIRTPFHGLMGMLSLLRETGLNARQTDYLRTATESADHLLALLNDILDMSQLESGRMALLPAPLELRAMLREVEALMRPQANAKSLALHIDADPAVPERVLADATRLKQIVLNLLSNAIKFSDRGAVVLDVRCHTADGDGRLLEFVVTDTGIGMDDETIKHLFNRFMQGDRTPSRRHAGSGLGLEISRNLARLMGGDITVRSRPGEGSCFTVRIPLQALPDAPGREAAAEAAGGTRALQVLVAEDHPVNRQYIAALLENLGHDAHFTTNGQEAVQALQDRRFDLVLMDLHMPVMDGVAATRAIRALPDPATSTVPIVALTADALAETRDRCLVAGMNGFLTKPVSPQKLATALRRLFGGAGPSEAPSPGGAPLPPATRGAAQPLVDAAAVHMSLQAMPAARLGTMIGAFLDQAPETVRRLRAAVRDAQPLELRVNAHAAKGAALNLGLTGLAATAEALQEGAAHLPAHEIARLVQRFDDQLPATRKAVAAMGLPGLAAEEGTRR